MRAAALGLVLAAACAPAASRDLAIPGVATVRVALDLPVPPTAPEFGVGASARMSHPLALLPDISAALVLGARAERIPELRPARVIERHSSGLWLSAVPPPRAGASVRFAAGNPAARINALSAVALGSGPAASESPPPSAPLPADYRGAAVAPRDGEDASPSPMPIRRQDDPPVTAVCP